MQKRFDVVGIGNAIVDILGHVDEAFLTKNELPKGGMMLVDEQRARSLYDQLGQTTECSGGSAANTLAALASFGAKAAFIGKVSKDQLGEIFTHDMRGVGVHFESKPSTSGPATASCIVAVTQDGERTMTPFLGACTRVSEEDVDEALIAASSVLYIEGYLWDIDAAKAAIRKAISAAKKSGGKVALTLSDAFCVGRFREEFLELIHESVDILFANESEILSLYETANFDEALKNIQGEVEVALITRSEKGAVVVTQEHAQPVAGERVAKVVDTTGAGDLFASGFLYGYTKGWDHTKSAALGNRSAAAIIQQLGARSMNPLDRLLAA